MIITVGGKMATKTTYRHVGPTTGAHKSWYEVPAGKVLHSFDTPINIGKPIERTFDDEYGYFLRWLEQAKLVVNYVDDGRPEYFYQVGVEKDLAQVLKADPQKVWTHLEDDDDGISYIVNGYERADLNPKVVGYYIGRSSAKYYPGIARVPSNYISDCTMCQGQDMDCLDCLGMNFVETHFFDI